LGVLVIWAALYGARAADWNQWRGPDRNGHAPNGPALADEWPETGLKKIWDSEETMRGGGHGGYGSVTLADGRLYLFHTVNYKVPIETRTLDARGLRRLGGRMKQPEGGLLKKIEDARVSEERSKLKKGGEVRKWAAEWAKKNLDKTQQKQFGHFARDRLHRGANALPLDLLAKLAALVGKPFANQAGLDNWLADNGLSADQKKLIARYFPTHVTRTHDTLVCLDAETGKTVWKKQYPGHPRGYGSSCTPTVVGGRVFVSGSNGGVFCLDAKTGDELWTHEARKAELTCSFILLDGLAIAPLGPLTAFDPATGQVKWQQKQVPYNHSSVVPWTKDGKAHGVVNSRKLFCFDPADGKVLWSVPGGGWSTPAISGDIVVVLGNNKRIGVTAYEMSKTGAKKLWTIDTLADRGASPIIVGEHVYALAKKKGLCIELRTGKVRWEKKVETNEIVAPVLLDGKLFLEGPKGSIQMLAPSAEEYKRLALAKVGLVACTTPAFGGERIYVRTGRGLSCFELPKKPTDEPKPQ
jgi:outer membrane protein assembly factor BamB